MRTKASSILLNTAIGIAVALAAWLVINALLTALTAKGVNDWTSKMFNTSAPPCLPLASGFNFAKTQTTDPGLFAGGGTGQLTPEQACASYGGLGDTSLEAPAATDAGVMCADGEVHSTQVAPGTALTPDQACVGSGGIAEDNGESTPGAGLGANQVRCANGDLKDLAPVGATLGPVPLSSNGNGCDPSMVSQAADAAGYPVSPSQANTLACISSGEDRCGQGPVRNYNWGRGSSAAGAYQVTMQDHSSCYDNPVCEQAAGTPGTALNCRAGFSGGNPRTDAASQTIVNRCLAAAADVRCSAGAAACLVQARPNFGDWGPYSSANASCVNQYNN